MNENSLNNSFWNLRYQNNQTGWDLGEISEPIKKWFDNQKNSDIKDRLLSGGSINIIYAKPWFWKCSSSKIKKPL
jgi:hypothetical protein